MVSRQFPQEFIFGTATASYQIEGAVSEDGRQPSIWDTFSHTPGKIVDGTTGDVTCDHYHRLDEDLDIIASLGSDAYRFSLAWPRIQPGGSGERNRAGIDFYQRLIDGLLERNVRPVVTLYHWDLPQALQDAGGWANRDTALRYAEYAQICAEEFGDRVHTFTTFNEPFCSVFQGHASGHHAPGLTDPLTTLRAAHHTNLAHGLGVQALRSGSTGQPEVSLTLNAATYYPATDSPDDRRAVELADMLHNQIFTGPTMHGRYPEGLFQATSEVTDWSFVQDGDLESCHQKLDHLGLNWYFPQWLRMLPEGQTHAEPSLLAGLPQVEFAPQPEGPTTDMGWPIIPEALHDQLLRWSQEFPGMPIYITENGCAYDDPVVDGQCRDPRRIEYLRDHLAQCLRAIDDGVDLRGYFCWTLLDNFEWAFGFTKRFGLVHVDYETLKRTPRDSATWYAELTRTHTLDVG